jgi:hypothetical protein
MAASFAPHKIANPNLDSLPSDILDYKITKSLPLVYCIALACVSKRLNRVVSKIVAAKKKLLPRDNKTISHILAPAVADGSVNLVAWFVTSLKFTNQKANTDILEAASSGNNHSLRS